MLTSHPYQRWLALCAGTVLTLTGCAGTPASNATQKSATATTTPRNAKDTTDALSAEEVEAGLSGVRLAPPAMLRMMKTREAAMKLEVQYALASLGNDPQGNPRTAFVRTYNGQLVGPTLRARPGDTLYLRLVNSLPDDPQDPAGAIAHRAGHGGHGGHGGKADRGGHAPRGGQADRGGHAPRGGQADKLKGDDISVNTPHGFNITNLHTHGLHVRPDAPSRCPNPDTCDARSDDVLVSVLPGQSQMYEIEIPKNHPPGTHWYHAHKHGAVAMQLATGMAGALIIEGGLDDLPELQRATEQVMVFQQLMLSPCGRQDVHLSATDAGGASEKCTVKNDKGEITAAYESCEAYFQRLNEGLKAQGQAPLPYPTGAQCVESFSLLFGPGKWATLVAPRFGDRTSINGQLGPTIDAKQGELQRWRLVHAGIRETLQLGLIRKEDLASQQVANAVHEPNSIRKRLPLQVVAYDGITTGRVDNVDNIELQPGYRVDALVRIDEPGDYYLVDLQTAGIDALRDKPEEFELLAKVNVAPSDEAPMALPKLEALANLAPYKHVEDTEVTGCQYTTFNIQLDETGKPRFMVNEQPYNPEAARRTMAVGTQEEWVVNSQVAAHPFHIHVNPFEVVDGYDSIPKGTWKDTLFVNQGKPVRLRTRYEDFTGKFVLHCHILDHEDQGMMQEVEVLPHGSKTSSCPTRTGYQSMCLFPPPLDGKCAQPATAGPKPLTSPR